jgi:hypothetical protein
LAQSLFCAEVVLFIILYFDLRAELRQQCLGPGAFVCLPEPTTSLALLVLRINAYLTFLREGTLYTIASSFLVQFYYCIQF